MNEGAFITRRFRPEPSELTKLWGRSILESYRSNMAFALVMKIDEQIMRQHRFYRCEKRKTANYERQEVEAIEIRSPRHTVTISGGGWLPD